jgi:predicted NAD-dependent protein-ADP-ribosyltransferase YbiA (DUF1768 family)
VAARNSRAARAVQEAKFYKAWDEWGALSNFSPHPIHMPYDSTVAGGPLRCWSSVEHYYQAQKFAGVSDEQAVRVGFVLCSPFVRWCQLSLLQRLCSSCLSDAA